MNHSVPPDSYAVPVEKLRWECPVDVFQFECTSDIEPLKEFIGQDRAIDSIDFGLAVDRAGYNLFLTGLTGTGKAATVQVKLKKFIEEKEAEGWKYEVFDWCYVHNFPDSDHPKMLKLAKGWGRVFHSDMEKLVKSLQIEIPKTLGSEEYNKQKQQIMAEHQKNSQDDMDALEKEARQNKLMVQLSSMGAAVVPLSNGSPMSREDFLALPAREKEKIEAKRLEIMQKVEATYSRFREREKTLAEKMRDIENKAGNIAVSSPFAELEKKYHEYPEVLEYLAQAKRHTLENLEIFSQQVPQIPGFGPGPSDQFIVYRVNIFVDNSTLAGPPIIIETNPHWFNMFGKIERKALMGTYSSDHTMIKAGAVQLAHAGYLILNVRDVVMNQGVWEGLKRAIKTREVGVEDPWQQFGFVMPQGMRPQQMPVDVKIIVMGEDYIYQVLNQYDEDFWDIFKVKADFDYQTERTDEIIKAYACFIRGCCDDEKLRPFDRSGAAKVIEFAARAAGDQEKLTARFGPLKDLLIEADFWAKKAGSERVSAAHVEQSIREKIHRLDLVSERIQKMIKEGTLMVDVQGEAQGQVNGLAVYDLGNFSFGKPNRITARTFLGRGGVINIERESQLSGRIHDKGVMILSGFLGWKYAQDKPLSLSASICFEQSYSGVEGDSASSTELYAIISSLAGVPIRQYIAVTGSVNQKGEVQPIGGVNYKIEGFYDVCKEKGLTGNQGVMIPWLNVRHLMLREDVIDAVRKGEFHIYAVKTIDEGIEVLTGMPAGTRRDDGAYPEGTVNYLVDKCLRDYADRLREYRQPSEAVSV